MMNAIDVQQLKSTADLITQKIGCVLAPLNHLSIQWFSQWNPQVSEAFQYVQESASPLSVLYPQLMQNPTAYRKCVAVISSRGEPVAVAGVKKISNHWEPITQWLVPGPVFPARENSISAVIDHLGLDLWIHHWRFETQQEYKNLRCVEMVPTYRMDFRQQDYESYWRESGFYNTVRRNRNRCSEFTFEIDHPGTAEWVIESWDKKWKRSTDAESHDLSDRLLVSKLLENIGVHHTFVLSDNGKPISGVTALVHDNDLVIQIQYKDPNYDRFGVGTRLLELIFEWGVKNGFNGIDMGGFHEYKKKWAPEKGAHRIINVCPNYLHQFKKLVKSYSPSSAKVGVEVSASES